MKNKNYKWLTGASLAATILAWPLLASADYHGHDDHRDRDRHGEYHGHGDDRGDHHGHMGNHGHYYHNGRHYNYFNNGSYYNYFYHGHYYNYFYHGQYYDFCQEIPGHWRHGHWVPPVMECR